MFQRIEEILHGIPGQVGCYIYYPATGERFAYQADMPLVAASVDQAAHPGGGLPPAGGGDDPL